MRLARLWDILVSRVCLQEQRKQSFLTLAKENQSPPGLYRSPPTFVFRKSSFCASISWPVFCFVLSLRSSLITWCIRPTSFTGTPSAYDSQRKWKKSVYYVWNMDIFLTKMHGFATGGLYSPPGAVWGTFYYGCVRFTSRLLNCWQKAPAYPPL